MIHTQHTYISMKRTHAYSDVGQKTHSPNIECTQTLDSNTIPNHKKQKHTITNGTGTKNLKTNPYIHTTYQKIHTLLPPQKHYKNKLSTNTILTHTQLRQRKHYHSQMTRTEELHTKEEQQMIITLKNHEL